MAFKVSNETKVGALAAVAITILVLGYNYLAGRDSIWSTGKTYYAYFDDLDGLGKSNAIIYKGYKIGQVSDLKFFDQASDALSFLSEAPQAVVISDLNLGVMEAWEFLDSLFSQGFQGKFFLMSSSIINSDRVRANADSRVSGFFEKPLSETDLIQILQA